SAPSRGATCPDGRASRPPGTATVRARPGRTTPRSGRYLGPPLGPPAMSAGYGGSEERPRLGLGLLLTRRRARSPAHRRSPWPGTHRRRRSAGPPRRRRDWVGAGGGARGRPYANAPAAKRAASASSSAEGAVVSARCAWASTWTG